MDAASTSVVIAVIPLFNPPADLAQRVRALKDQVDEVVIVDDGSSLPAAPSEFAGAGIHRIDLPQNVGIAAALNAGVRYALGRGASHVLTLDQDSTVDRGYVAAALETIAAARRPDRAIAVPGVAGGNAVLTHIDGTGAKVPFDPIQSGWVMPVAAFDEIGAFTEQLVIDAVDSDFTVRARAAGWDFVIIEGSAIGHSLGELVPVRIFGRHLTLGGKPRHVLYHSPLRTYYMTRNSIFLIQRYKSGNGGWLLLRSWKMIEMLGGCLILAPDRGLQARALRYGLRDARRRAYGKIAPATLARIQRTAES